MNRLPVGGGVVALNAMDYINLNRPDIYTEKSVVKGGILKTPPKQNKVAPPWVNLVTSIMLIVLSAFIFACVISALTVVQSALDAHFINEVIHVQTTSRLYYAGITLVITLLITALFLYIYMAYIFPHIPQ